MTDLVAATKAHPAFRVSSAATLERLAAQLEAGDVPVTRPGCGEFPGKLRLHVGDPWGNRIELVA